MTRNLLLCAFFMSVSFITSAQFKKNDILLGGQLSYGYSSSSFTQPNPSYPSSDQKINNGNISISAGKALNENTLIGIDLSYLPSSITNYVNYDPIPLKYR